MPIFPVSLMISGISFVSSILEDINSSNYEVLRRSAIAISMKRTSDIFTDCESACDKDSFVLPRFELKCSGWSEMKRRTYSWSLFGVLLHRCKFCSSVKFICKVLDGSDLTDCSWRNSNSDPPFRCLRVLQIFVSVWGGKCFLDNYPIFLSRNVF